MYGRWGWRGRRHTSARWSSWSRSWSLHPSPAASRPPGERRLLHVRRSAVAAVIYLVLCPAALDLTAEREVVAAEGLGPQMTTTPAPDLLVVGARARRPRSVCRRDRRAPATASPRSGTAATSSPSTRVADGSCRRGVPRSCQASRTPTSTRPSPDAISFGSGSTTCPAARPISTPSRFAANHPSRPWVVGGGWAMEDFPDGLAARRTSTRSSRTNRSSSSTGDVHSAWVNSAALLAGGIEDTVDRATGASSATLEPGNRQRATRARPTRSTIAWSLPVASSGRKAILTAQGTCTRHGHHRIAERVGHALDARGMPPAASRRTVGSPRASSGHCGGTATAAWTRSPTSAASGRPPPRPCRLERTRVPPDERGRG